MANLITNEQMAICSDLFDLGFSYKMLFDNGDITLSKNTTGGIVVLILSTDGKLNDSPKEEFFNFYKENAYIMSKPESIGIIPSKF